MFQKTILKIGITGGIGSGKTTVCHIFETLGIPIYYADDRAKALMVENAELVKQIKNLFGEAAYLKDGALNRQHIADIVFHNPLKLNELNALVHPAVWLDGETWHAAQTYAPYTMKEAALLFESGGNRFLDKIITVVAPVETRIERVILRGGGTMKRADVEARIAKQMSDEEKVKLSDFVIQNDGSQALIPQVMAIHRLIENGRMNE
jgi:dephospho-CoA kinase